jgi:hypothetical protein
LILAQATAKGANQAGMHHAMNDDGITKVIPRPQLIAKHAQLEDAVSG